MSDNENTTIEEKLDSSNILDKKESNSANEVKNDLVQPQQANICDTKKDDTETKNQDEEHCECTICYLPLQQNTDKVILEECGHIFHSACIRLWMKQKRTCPFCAGFSLLPEEYPPLT